MKQPLSLIALILFLSSCSFDDENLDLLCRGKHTETVISNGKSSTLIKDEIWSLHFKNKKMYRPEDSQYISPKCPVWNKEFILCQKIEDEKSALNGEELKLDRGTGEVTYYMPFKNGAYQSNDLYRGTCEASKKL